MCASVVLLMLLLHFQTYVASPIPYQRRGVMSWNVGPPSAFWWNRTQKMMVGFLCKHAQLFMCQASNYTRMRSMQLPVEARFHMDFYCAWCYQIFESARFCSDKGRTAWPHTEESFSNHSYFRIRDMDSGAIVGNVEGSERFAYGSAVVDPVFQRAWVFGSVMDLCNRSWSKTVPTKIRNSVRAWWSDDLIHWHTSDAPALEFTSYPFNTDVTAVANKMLVHGHGGAALRATDSVPGDPKLNFVLVSEHGKVAVHDAPDRNLTRGWKFVEQHSTRLGFGACPAVHYGEDDGECLIVFSSDCT